MKRPRYFLFVFLSGLILLPPGLQAGETFHPQGSIRRKLERGSANMLLGGLEFAYRFRQPDNGDKLPPWMKGLVQAAYYTVVRTLAGVYEVVTFPFPIPADYLPLMNPEFVWEYPPKKK